MKILYNRAGKDWEKRERECVNYGGYNRRTGKLGYMFRNEEQCVLSSEDVVKNRQTHKHPTK